MRHSRRPSWSSRLGGLAPTLGVVAAAAAALGWPAGGPAHRDAVCFAAATCLAGTFGAWLLGGWPAVTPAGRVTASLGATGLRLFPALLALGWLQTGGRVLREANAGELLVVFYLVALAVDLFRTMMAGPAGGRRPRDGEAI